MGFSVNHLSGGGVNANHDATHKPSLACKNKTENDSRLFKNSEGNHDDEWTFLKGRRQTLLYSCKKQEQERSEKSSNKTSLLLSETGRS